LRSSSSTTRILAFRFIASLSRTLSATTSGNTATHSIPLRAVRQSTWFARMHPPIRMNWCQASWKRITKARKHEIEAKYPFEETMLLVFFVFSSLRAFVMNHFVMNADRKEQNLRTRAAIARTADPAADRQPACVPRFRNHSPWQWGWFRYPRKWPGCCVF
jgi:hypothetical protein